MLGWRCKTKSAPALVEQPGAWLASLLIDVGVNAKAIQEFMGHATIEETLSRYGHLMPGARDQARELVDTYLGAAMGEPADAALAA